MIPLRIVRLTVFVCLVLGMLAGMASAGNKTEEEVAYGRWWLRPALVEALSLDNAMVNRLDTLYVERKSRLIDLKAAVQKERMKLSVLMDQEPLDKAGVMRQYEVLNEIRGEMGRERFKYYIEIRDILGPERYRKAVAMYKERGKKIREAMKMIDGELGK